MHSGSVELIFTKDKTLFSIIFWQGRHSIRSGCCCWFLNHNYDWSVTGGSGRDQAQWKAGRVRPDYSHHTSPPCLASPYLTSGDNSDMIYFSHQSSYNLVLLSVSAKLGTFSNLLFSKHNVQQQIRTFFADDIWNYHLELNANIMMMEQDITKQFVFILQFSTSLHVTNAATKNS